MFAFMFSGNAFSILKSNDYVLSTVSLCIVLTEFNANCPHRSWFWKRVFENALFDIAITGFLRSRWYLGFWVTAISWSSHHRDWTLRRPSLSELSMGCWMPRVLLISSTISSDTSSTLESIQTSTSIQLVSNRSLLPRNWVAGMQIEGSAAEMQELMASAILIFCL